MNRKHSLFPEQAFPTWCGSCGNNKNNPISSCRVHLPLPVISAATAGGVGANRINCQHRTASIPQWGLSPSLCSTSECYFLNTSLPSPVRSLATNPMIIFPFLSHNLLCEIGAQNISVDWSDLCLFACCLLIHKKTLLLRNNGWGATLQVLLVASRASPMVTNPAPHHRPYKGTGGGAWMFTGALLPFLNASGVCGSPKSTICKDFGAPTSGDWHFMSQTGHWLSQWAECPVPIPS